MKGDIRPDHIPQNKYTLRVQGLPPILFIKVEGLETELETTELPDRTVASGGNTKASELTVEIMLHHTAEVAAMEQWFRDSQDPVALGYKRTGTLVHKSISSLHSKSWRLKGVFPKKRKASDLEMKNEGDAVTVTWTLSVDEISKL